MWSSRTRSYHPRSSCPTALASLRATKQQISKQYGLRAAPQQQQPDRRGEVAAFQNAGRHPQAQPLWLVCPGVLRGSRIALYYRRRLLSTPCRSFNSWKVAASIRSSTRIASSARQAKPYQPAGRVMWSSRTRSYHPRSSCPTALASLRATKQQISKQYGLRAAPQQQQQPDRRGEVAAFQNAGRHPQAQPLWLDCPGVLRGSRIALYYRRGLLNTPCRSFNSWNVAAGERAQRVR
jgi:hypothetical protein